MDEEGNDESSEGSGSKEKKKKDKKKIKTKNNVNGMLYATYKFFDLVQSEGKPENTQKAEALL
jgi:hypothetical protein